MHSLLLRRSSQWGDLDPCSQLLGVLQLRHPRRRPRGWEKVIAAVPGVWLGAHVLRIPAG